MSRSAALPFTLQRSDSVVGEEITSTTERVHGLLRFDEGRLVLQWRTSRSTSHVGSEIRTDRELGDVREAVVPLDALAAARVRWLWTRWPPGHYLVLTGADLRAFEAAAGAEALGMDHPAELVLRIRWTDRDSAREFAAELEHAVAERALRAAEEPSRLEPGPSGP